MAKKNIDTYPVIGNGNAQSRKHPNIDSEIYDWRVIEWIGNYSVAKIEYWIPDPLSSAPY